MFDAYPALQLNADYRPLSYFPLSLLTAEHAIKLVHEDVLTVVAEYDREIRSPSTTMKLPSVVALKRYVPPSRHVAFTRFNVFLRDGFRCQYCGEKHRADDLTFDHVVPRCDGGPTSWTNIVSACEPCNTKKATRRLTPIREPFRPTPAQLAKAQRAFPPKHLHQSWYDYLYWDTEIEA